MVACASGDHRRAARQRRRTRPRSRPIPSPNPGASPGPARQADAGREQPGAGQVGAGLGPARPCSRARPAGPALTGDRADRQVDPEHPPPADLDQDAPDHGTEAGTEGGEGRPRPDGLGPGQAPGPRPAAATATPAPSCPPPTAWTTRAAISASTPGATPHSSEPALKVNQPADEAAYGVRPGRPNGRPAPARRRTRSCSR